MKSSISLLLFVFSIASCVSAKPIIGEDGWPIRPSSRKLRCPLGTSLHDTTLSNGARKVSCKKGDIPLARGFEAAWSPAGILTYLFTTLDDGTPISKIGYHINGVKSSEEIFKDGVLIRSNAWFDNGDLKYEALTSDVGTFITKWDNSRNVEIKGTRKKGKREGKWQEFVEGAMEFSNYVKGKKHGEIRREYLDGSIETGRFEFGKKEGAWIRGKGDFLDYRVFYHNDFLEGESVYYHPNRALKKKGVYHLGKKVGSWRTFYHNGKVSTQGEFICDEEHGLWKSFHKSGDRKEEGSYLKGQKTGNWRQWNDAGELLKVEEFPIPLISNSKSEPVLSVEPQTCK